MCPPDCSIYSNTLLDRLLGNLIGKYFVQKFFYYPESFVTNVFFFCSCFLLYSPEFQTDFSVWLKRKQAIIYRQQSIQMNGNLFDIEQIREYLFI